MPVKVLASATAVTVIDELPSNGTPLILTGAASLVAVPALPVTLPTIGLVTVKPVNVPTLVSDEFTTFAANVVPVKVLASAVTVAVPPNATAVPLMVTPLLVNIALLTEPAWMPIVLAALPS